MLLLFPVPGLAFIDIQRMPYSLCDTNGGTVYWNDSYSITVGDLQIQMVVGDAQISGKGGIETINWDPEIVSIKIEDEEVMRRTGLMGFIKNDPLVQMPFLGIGGLVSPINFVKKVNPLGAPPTTLTWISQGDDGRVAWTSSYSYSEGDKVLWLNRTFVLNSSLHIECEFEAADDYQALEQRITITNGETGQYLPFPLETAFSLGTKLQGRGISLPNMTLSPEQYFTYPAALLPPGWFNISTLAFELPDRMWKEEDLPGMLYVEFDLDSRNWFGMATVTELPYEMKVGVGVKVISTHNLEQLRPYFILVSGPGDHVVFGFKPFDVAGRYDKFHPLKLDPSESISMDLLWFFPETGEDAMSLLDLEAFAEDTITVSDFLDLRREAEQLFEEANIYAAEGSVQKAVDKAQMSITIYEELGDLSDVMFEEGRKINATINGWVSAAADSIPHPDKGGRSGIVYSLLLVLCLILVLVAWIYVIEPRRSRAEKEP